MDVQTRPATHDDFVFARAVHHAAYRDVVERQFGGWDEDQQDAFFSQDWQLELAEIVLADGQRCGYRIVEERSTDIHLRELVVQPDCQSLGIGRFLLTKLQQRAGARQVPVRLGTLLQNRAIALYERLGFRIIDRTDTHILMEWSPEPG
jgi:ribosomal protein S18 acetylase RimI-like enzyme